MKSASGFGRSRRWASGIILFIAVTLFVCPPAMAKGKANDQWMTWDEVYLHIYDWWGKTSAEKIDVQKIEPILLANHEPAYLAGTWFFSRGRNFIDGAILVRPALKEARDVSEYCGSEFEVRDLDRDGVSEIRTQIIGSGQGITSGIKRILQFDGWAPVILHEADFVDNSGACGGDDCGNKSVEWQFLELPGRTNVLEIIHFSSGAADSRTLLTMYALQDKKFTPFNGAVMKWDEAAGAKPEGAAGRKQPENRPPLNFAMDRSQSRYFEEAARVYRESVHKPHLPSEIEELSKKADKAAKDKSYNLTSAIGMYNEALRKVSWWPGGYFKRAFLHAELGHYGSALQDLDRYLMLEPASADADIAWEKIHTWKETLLNQNFEEMAVIPGGEFMMGSPSCADGQRYSLKTKLPCDNELPQHRVTIKRFEMGKYDVTHDQWNACVADGGCKAYRGDGKLPVNSVSWENAQAYIAWLNKKTGKHYRLPTEAEWEYAARAGTATDYYWGDKADDSQANISVWPRRSDRDERTTPVGAFPPNAFGLYDMSGNVWQHVEDCYHDNYEGAPTDGSAWVEGDCGVRVKRGGSYNDIFRYTRSASRGQSRIKDIQFATGFRLARSLE